MNVKNKELYLLGKCKEGRGQGGCEQRIERIMKMQKSWGQVGGGRAVGGRG